MCCADGVRHSRAHYQRVSTSGRSKGRPVRAIACLRGGAVGRSLVVMVQADWLHRNALFDAVLHAMQLPERLYWLPGAAAAQVFNGLHGNKSSSPGALRECIAQPGAG